MIIKWKSEYKQFIKNLAQNKHSINLSQCDDYNNDDDGGAGGGGGYYYFYYSHTFAMASQDLWKPFIWKGHKPSVCNI